MVTAFASVGPKLGALLAAATLFSIPFAALGAVFPVTLRLWTESMEELGRRSGLLSALSAGGSLAGAASAGFILVPSLSLETIFGACAAVLFLLCGLVLLAGGLRIRGLCIIVIGFLPVLVPVRSFGTGVVCRRASLFGPVEVVDRGNVRFLVVSGTVQGAMIRDG